MLASQRAPGNPTTHLGRQCKHRQARRLQAPLRAITMPQSEAQQIAYHASGRCPGFTTPSCLSPTACTWVRPQTAQGSAATGGTGSNPVAGHLYSALARQACCLRDFNKRSMFGDLRGPLVGVTGAPQGLVESRVTSEVQPLQLAAAWRVAPRCLVAGVA